MKYKSGTMAMVNHTFTSEQLNDKLFYEYNKIRVIEPLITSAINNVADNLETEFSGLEYSVKTAPSVEDKLLRAEKRDTSGRFSPKRELANFKDMIRYTEICNHRDIASVTKDTIEFMKEQGYTLSGTKNYYTHPFGATGYKGIHLNFISPYGQEIELQVHSKESFDAKQKGHELYEKIRAVSTLKRDKEAMKEEIKRIHGIVKNPPNIEAIHDYKMPQKEKEKLLSIGKEQTLVEYESKRTDSNSEAIRFSVYYGNQESQKEVFVYVSQDKKKDCNWITGSSLGRRRSRRK